VIDVGALRGVREEVLVVAYVGAASDWLETQVGVVGELAREPSRVGSLPEGRSLIVLGRASMGSHERLKPAGVDGCEAGQIDDDVRRVAGLCIELALQQSRGGVIELAAQPEDQHVRSVLGADGERAGRGPLSFAGYRVLAAIRCDLGVHLVLDCSKRRSDP